MSEDPLVQHWRSSWDQHSKENIRKGDQPTEVLPQLFLSGHPARWEGQRGGLITNPPGTLLGKFGVRLIVCCCASKSVAPFVMVDTKTGDTTVIDSQDEFIGMVQSTSMEAAQAATSTVMEEKRAEAAEKTDEVDDANHPGLRAAGLAGKTLLVLPSNPVIFKLNIAADDVSTFDMTPFFDVATKCIDAAWAQHRETSRKEGGETVPPSNLAGPTVMNSTGDTMLPAVLVHCQAGASRSATILSAFLSAKYGISCQEAVKFLEMRRPHVVNPNPGFVKQLDTWWEQGASGMRPSHGDRPQEESS